MTRARVARPQTTALLRSRRHTVRQPGDADAGPVQRAALQWLRRSGRSRRALGAPRMRDGSGFRPIQELSTAVGIVFLLVGVMGFLPGITRDALGPSPTTTESPTVLLGLWKVTVLHNIVHLMFGFVGLLMAQSVRSARHYLVSGGMVYLLLYLYVMAASQDYSTSISASGADHILHFTLATGMILFGVLLGRRDSFSESAGSSAMKRQSAPPDQIALAVLVGGSQ